MSCERGLGALQKLPKPNLRGHCVQSFHRNILISMAVGGTAAFLFHMLYFKPRRRREEEFRKNYDPYKDEERMAALGLFQADGGRAETTEPGATEDGSGETAKRNLECP